MMPSPRQSLLVGALLLATDVVSSKPLACANVPASFNLNYTSSEVSFKITNATHYADHIPLDFENESWNLTTTIGLPAFCRESRDTFTIIIMLIEPQVLKSTLRRPTPPQHTLRSGFRTPSNGMADFSEPEPAV